MEISGKITKMFDLKTFDSGFQLREFVVTTNEQYPQPLSMRFVNERCNILESFSEGDDVTAYCDIRGREYNGRYFVNLQAWKMEKLSQEQPTDDLLADEIPTQSNDVLLEESQEEDDLPF